MPLKCKSNDFINEITYSIFHCSVHRNEILAAAVHEYTDWERPLQHPISVRDETIDALSDAQVSFKLTN